MPRLDVEQQVGRMTELDAVQSHGHAETGSRGEGPHAVMLSIRADAAQTSTARDERHEPAGDCGEVGWALRRLDVNPEELLGVRADRDHEPAARLKLLEEPRRRLARGGGDGDGVERRFG